MAKFFVIVGLKNWFKKNRIAFLYGWGAFMVFNIIYFLSVFGGFNILMIIVSAIIGIVFGFLGILVKYLLVP